MSLYSCPGLHSQRPDDIMQVSSPIIALNMYFQHLSADIIATTAALSVLMPALGNAVHHDLRYFLHSATHHLQQGPFISVSNQAFFTGMTLLTGINF